MRAPRLTFLCLLLLPWMARAVPTITRDLDVNAVEQRQSLTFLQAATPRVEFRILQGGRPLPGLSGYTATLKYGDDLTPTAGWVVVSSANTDHVNSRIRFNFDAEDTNTNGTFKAVVQLLDGSGGLYYSGTINLSILESTANTGADTLELGSTIDWAGSTYTNTASAGPYTAGTNITFTAGSSGKVVVNSKVVGTAAAGRILYGDADGTWKALAAGTSGHVLQSNGAAAPSWVIGGGGSGDLTEVQVSGGLLSVTSGTGPVPVVGLTQTTLNALYLRLVGDTMTGDLLMSETDGTFRNITLDATNVADEDSVGAVYFTASALGQTASVGAVVGTSGDGMVLALNAGGGAASSLLLDGVTDVATFSGRVIADNFQGNGEDLTLLTADQLTGDIPAASFGEVRIDFLATDFTLRTVEEVGYTTYSLTSGDNSLHVQCYKSANTSEQDFILHSAPVVVPRGFTTFKTTGAIDIDWIADSTTVADIRGIRLIKYVSGTPTVLYSDTTTRNVGTINTPANISINRSAFTSTTIAAGDHLVVEITGTIEDSMCLALLHVCIHSE